VRRLPVLDRDPMSLIATQPGEQQRGRCRHQRTRSSFSNVTLDGINIQDNFIRTAA